MNRQQLIEDNMKLVYFLVRKYYPNFIHDEDIIQTGMIGLCQAADTWDESKSLFSTYASRCILNAISLEFRSRNKHQGILSLNYPVKGAEHQLDEFGDLQVGEFDVDYVDVEPVMKKLTPRGREVFTLLQKGLSPVEITEKYGWSRERTSQMMRKIRLAWENVYGNHDSLSCGYSTSDEDREGRLD